MSWFPVDDGLDGHPKARKAGDDALGMWVRAGSHCMRYLTDGFVADWWVKDQPKGSTKARRLVDAGLWTAGRCDGEEGYWFHQWKPECTKKHVLEMREKARLRKAKQRESQQESRVTADVSPADCLVPTQPNPTQPSISVVDLGGDVTQVDATEPPPRCSKHLNDDHPPNCIPCRNARLANEKWHEGALERRRQARAAAKAIADACPTCLGTNVIDVGDNEVRKCDHQEQAHA